MTEKPVVSINRVTTKQGDDGFTMSCDMQRRVSKSEDPRLLAIAELDELNSWLGLVGMNKVPSLSGMLLRVQNELFDLGTDIGFPMSEENRHRKRLDMGYIERLEEDTKGLREPLEPLTSFILPGGTEAAARLHVARTVCRRAERSVWSAIHSLGEGQQVEGGVNRLAGIYLNRLSDFLFVGARYANFAAGKRDVLWQPGGER